MPMPDQRSNYQVSIQLIQLRFWRVKLILEDRAIEQFSCLRGLDTPLK